MPIQKPKKSIEIKEKILLEATRLFSDRGFDGISLRDVASACDIPLSTLCHHFPLKQSLQEAVTYRAMDLAMAAVSVPLAATGNPRQRLEEYIANMVKLCLSDIPEFKLIDREFQSLDQDFIRDAVVRSIIDKPTSLATLIQEMDPDILKHIPAKRLSDILFSMIYGFIKLRPVHYYETGAEYVTKEAIIRDVILMFTRAINHVTPAAKPEQGKDYFAVLGRFVHEFSATEEIMQILLMQYAQVSHGTAKVLFSGEKADEVRNRIALLCEANGSRNGPHLAPALEQFRIIEEARRNLLHPSPRFSNIDAVVSSQVSSISGHTRHLSVSVKSLNDMILDLHSIRSGLLLSVIEGIPTDTDFKRQLEHSAKPSWKYNISKLHSVS